MKLCILSECCSQLFLHSLKNDNRKYFLSFKLHHSTYQIYIFIYLSLNKEIEQYSFRKKIFVQIQTHTHFFSFSQNPSQGVSFERFWGQMLVYSLTETIMMLLTVLRYCTLYDNRLEKASLKVIIMRTSRRTHFRLRNWEGIISLMEQAELWIHVHVILLLLRNLLKQISCTLRQAFCSS